jgi:hypothetical protein
MDLDQMIGSSSRLTGILPDCLDRLPFEPADRHELWLLDEEGLPFALLASATRAPFGTRVRPEPWAAAARSDQGFRSDRLLNRGIPLRDGHDPRHHASLLERLVRDTAGRPPRMAWFLRDAAGGGTARDDGGEPARPLGADAFPPLLLREHWPDEAAGDLVRDYLDWCAPFLLTLPTLNDAQRERFEQAARNRALEVDHLHRLYPKVLNPGLVKAIRVEARMRRTAMA